MSKIKVFQGTSVNEALEKAIRELGPEAMIISTRNFNPEANLLNKKKSALVEITAIASDKNFESLPVPADPNKLLNLPLKAANFNHPSQEINYLKKEITKIYKLLEKEKKQNEIRQSMLDTIIANYSDLESFLSSVDYRKQPEQTSENLSIFSKKLQDFAFDGDYISLFIKLIRNQVKEEDHQDLNQIKVCFNDFLFKSIAPLYQEEFQLKKFNLFFGKSSSGKKTQIAKMAVDLLNSDSKIAICSLAPKNSDQIDHLFTLSELFSFPYLKSQNIKDFIKFLTDASSAEYIFIDGGEIPVDVDNLLKLMEKNPEMKKNLNKFLVIEIADSPMKIYEKIEMYKKISYKNLILTKMDLTSNFGNIFNVLMYCNLPVSFISTGKLIPDDIEFTNLEKILGYLKIF